MFLDLCEFWLLYDISFPKRGGGGRREIIKLTLKEAITITITEVRYFLIIKCLGKEMSIAIKASQLLYFKTFYLILINCCSFFIWKEPSK